MKGSRIPLPFDVLWKAVRKARTSRAGNRLLRIFPLKCVKVENDFSLSTCYPSFMRGNNLDICMLLQTLLKIYISSLSFFSSLHSLDDDIVILFFSSSVKIDTSTESTSNSQNLPNLMHSPDNDLDISASSISSFPTLNESFGMTSSEHKHHTPDKRWGLLEPFGIVIRRPWKFIPKMLCFF